MAVVSSSPMSLFDLCRAGCMTAKPLRVPQSQDLTADVANPSDAVGHRNREIIPEIHRICRENA